jgi:hypothetical protein
LQFGEDGLLLAANIEVDEGNADLLQVEQFAAQPAVDARLRPVQMPMVVGNGAELAAIRLDLFHLVQAGVVTVRPAANLQGTEGIGEAQFGLVALAATSGDELMPRHALLRGGRRREAQVEVAALGGELAQRAYRDGVGGLVGHIYCMDIQ